MKQGDTHIPPLDGCLWPRCTCPERVCSPQGQLRPTGTLVRTMEERSQAHEASTPES